MKTALVFPRTKYLSGDPPIGIATIAACVRREMPHVEISIVDSTFSRKLEYINTSLKNIRPDIVGIFSDTIMYDDAVRVAKWAKAIGALVVTGGPHATVCPESLSGVSDIVVQGEGEKVFVDILKYFEQGGISAVKKNLVPAGNNVIWFSKAPVENLDGLPFPAFDLLDMDNYTAHWGYLDSLDISLKGTTMMTSRGCPYRCTYCQPTLELLFGSKLRRRSPLNVVEEMKYLKNAFSINAVFFHDDTFTIDKKWIEELCEILRKEDLGMLWGCNSRINTASEDMLSLMYGAGLRNIHFGIESGSQRILDDIYQKKIRLDDVERVVSVAKKIGIHTLGFFMLGAPTETEEETRKTIETARNLPLDEATFSIATPLPGTFLYDRVKASGEREISADSKDFDYYRTGAVKKDTKDAFRIKRFQYIALFRFYLSRKRYIYIFKHLLSIRGARKLLSKVRRFF